MTLAVHIVEGGIYVTVIATGVWLLAREVRLYRRVARIERRREARKGFVNYPRFLPGRRLP